MNWREYEVYITRHFQRQFPESLIRHNVYLYSAARI